MPPGTDDLTVTIAGSGGLDPATRAYLKSVMAKHADEVLSEAELLELGARSGPGPAQITATHIHNANLRRLYVPPGPNPRRKTFEGLNILSATGAGIFGGWAVTAPYALIGFFICLGAALFLNDKART